MRAAEEIIIVLGGVGLPFVAPVQLSAMSPSADGQCWFHEPRALASAGKLWFGTNGSNDNTTATGRATLYEIDESSNAVTHKDLITGTDWGDDHNYPVVLQRSDGRLVAFYCAHNITAPIRFRVSVSAGTIGGGWSQEYTIGVDALNPTYPSPVRLSAENNKVFLFFRNGVAGSLSYITSSDLDAVAAAAGDGAALGATPTWSSETQLTVSTGSKKGIYTKVNSNGVERIDIFSTAAEQDAAGVKKDVRHGYYVGGNWYGSLGNSLGNASVAIDFTLFTAVATSGAPDSFGDVWVWHMQNRATSNLAPNPDAFGAWALSNVTVSADVAANPLDGTATADRITDTSNTGGHSTTFASSVNFVSGRAYVFSVIAKFETAQFLQLLFPMAAFGANAYANFDIQNGAIGTVGSSATASIEPLSVAGWYRIIVRAGATATASGTCAVYGADASNAARAPSYLGSGQTRLLFRGRCAEETIEGLFARLVSTSDHRYYYARWNGLTWSKTEIDAGYGSGTPDTRSAQITDGAGASEGYYSPGMYLDTQEEGVLYCAVGYSTYSVVYRYVTADRGSTWTRQRVSGMVKENIRPFVPLNRTAKYAFLWASGDYHFWNFNSTNDTSYGYTTNVFAASRGYGVGSAAPSNSAIPKISGTAAVGNVLTASTGTWSGDLPMPFTYQWNKDSVAIGGQTSSTYTVASGDVGHNLSVTVTATNAFGNSSATSAAAPGLPVNLFLHSEAVDQWTAGNITVTTNVAAEPINGQSTADRVTESVLASSVQHNTNSPSISFASATAYTFSVCAKYESRQYLQLLYGSGAFGLNAYANFDIQNGTVQTVGSSASASIVSLGNGWYRLIMTATTTGAASVVAGVYGVDAANAARGEAYVAGTAHTWLLADAQVETGSVANTYVPTA